MLIVPGGLIQRLKGDNPANLSSKVREKKWVEQLAIETVMEVERKLGFEPRDVSASRYGYDIESRIPDTGQLRFIVVKSRLPGASTVTFRKNEIITALNKQKNFVLALVEVSESAQFSIDNSTVRYVCRPLPRHSDFAVTSISCGWQQLWNLGQEI